MKTIAQKFQDILKIESHPVAVKFSTELPDWDGFVKAEKSRYCQALMRARNGEKVYLTPDEITCPASASALGFKEAPEKLTSGEMLSSFGIFGSADAGKRTISDMPKIEIGKYKAIALSPLSVAPYFPDVVVVESIVEHIMWLALAYIRNTGGRYNFSTGILQATCVDSTILPFLSGEVNMSFGCYGCREATDMQDNEAIIGIPGSKLQGIADSLSELAEKAITRVRSKNVYKAYMERLSQS